MLKVVIAALCLVGLAHAIPSPKGEVGFEVCDSANLATVNEFHVSDCPDGANHCEFVVGHNYTFTLHATVHANHPVANNLPFKVTVRILGIPITLAEGDACETATCPVNPGDNVVVTLTKQIPTSVPAFSNLAVTARVWGNEAGNNPSASTCASITASIVKP